MHINVNKILQQLKVQSRWFIIAMLPMMVMANPITTDPSEWEDEIEAQIEQENRLEPGDGEKAKSQNAEPISGPTIPCTEMPWCMGE